MPDAVGVNVFYLRRPRELMSGLAQWSGERWSAGVELLPAVRSCGGFSQMSDRQVDHLRRQTEGLARDDNPRLMETLNVTGGQITEL